MGCPKCGGNMINVKEVKIKREPYEPEEEDTYDDGFIGQCEVCGYEDCWY